MNGGANRLTVITHEDLTQASANTAQALVIAVLAAGMAMRINRVDLLEAFEKAGDAAFNTTPMRIGDSGDDDRLFPAVELNKNGTELSVSWASTPAAATYTAPSATPAAITGGEAPTEAEFLALRTMADSVRTQLIALAADVDAMRVRDSATGFLVASETTVNATFGSMSGKALADLDKGEVRIYWTLFQVV